MGSPWGSVSMFLVLKWWRGVLSHRCHSFVQQEKMIGRGMSKGAILHWCRLWGVFLQRHPWRHQWQWWKVCWGWGERELVVWRIHLSVGQMLSDKKVTISTPSFSLWGKWVGGWCFSSPLWIFCSNWWIPKRIEHPLLLLGLAILRFQTTLWSPWRFLRVGVWVPKSPPLLLQTCISLVLGGGPVLSSFEELFLFIWHFLFHWQP